MELTRADVEKVALLGRLALSDDELERLTGDLRGILGYVEQLAAVDTAGVEPLAHALPLRNVFRDDAVGPMLPTEAALANAPKRVGEFYAVPPVLD